MDVEPYLPLLVCGHEQVLSHSVPLCRICKMEYLPQFLKMVKLDNMCNPYSYWSCYWGLLWTCYCTTIIVWYTLMGKAETWAYGSTEVKFCFY